MESEKKNDKNSQGKRIIKVLSLSKAMTENRQMQIFTVVQRASR
jgi:hypothetical protein